MRAGIAAFIAALMVGAALLLATYFEPMTASLEAGPAGQPPATVDSPFIDIEIGGAGIIHVQAGPLLDYLRPTSAALDLAGIGLSVYLFLFIRRKTSWSSVVDKMREQPLLLMPAILIAAALVLLIPLPATVAVGGGEATFLTNAYEAAAGPLYFAGIALAALLMRFYGYDYDVAYSTFNFDMLDSETIYVDQFDETAAS